MIPLPPPANTVPRFAPLPGAMLRFQGVNSFVSAPLPPDAEWEGATGFTVLFWANISELTPSATWRIVGISLASPQAAWWAVSMGMDGTRELLVYFSTFGHFSIPLAGIGDWIFVASTFDAAAMTYTVSVNTVISVTRAQTAPTSLARTGPLVIGGTDVSGAPGFQGTIWRVSLYKEPLPLERIVAEMRDNRMGATAETGRAGLVGSWRLNEGFGAVAFDYARPRGSDGLLGGAVGPEGEAFAPAWVLGSAPNAG